MDQRELYCPQVGPGEPDTLVKSPEFPNGKRRPYGALLQFTVGLWGQMYSVGRRFRHPVARQGRAAHGTLPIWNRSSNSERKTSVDRQFGWGGTPLKRYQGCPKVGSSGSEIRCRVQRQKPASRRPAWQRTPGRKSGLANLCTSTMGVRDDRKATLGITELSSARAHIDPKACYIDVGSLHPGRAAAAKGEVVRLLKEIVSWV